MPASSGGARSQYPFEAGNCTHAQVDGMREMTFHYADSFCAAHAFEGYQRLLLDAMLGDQSLFTTAASVEHLWEISAPLPQDPTPIQPYAAGS